MKKAFQLIIVFAFLGVSAGAQQLGVWNTSGHLSLGDPGGSEYMRLTTAGFLGLGTLSPTQLFSVAEKFQVDANGDIVKLNNVTTAFPAANASGVLTNDGAGALSWAALPAESNDWKLLGNSGTTNGTNFIGTTDGQNLDIRTNNVITARFTQKGQIEVFGTGQSVFIGQGAGAADDLSSNQNVFVGYQAGNSNTSGYYNVASGYQSLLANTSGLSNTAIGRFALKSNVTSSNNVAVGAGTLSSSTAENNTAVGASSQESNTTGSDNSSFGSFALYKNLTGQRNVAIGSGAIQGISGGSGNYNSAIGYQSLRNTETGDYNTAIGAQSLYSNSAGANATVVGAYAMQYANNTATPFTNYNVAVGYEALRGSTTAANNTGNYNTALGYQTLWSTTSGGNNTALGYLAGYTTTAANAVTSGANNTFLGYNTGFASATQRTNATAIGYNAKVDADNTLILGGTGADAVNVGVGTSTPSRQLHLSSNGGGGLLISRSESSGNSNSIDIQKSRGTMAGELIVNSVDELGELAFKGYDGAAYQFGARILAFVDGTPGAGDMPGRLAFYTTPDGSSTSAVRMVIKNDGNVGIGTSAPVTQLHLYDGDVTELTMGFNDVASGWGELKFRDETSGNVKWSTGISSDVYTVPELRNAWFIHQYRDMAESVVNQYRLVIDDIGNVGIGTTTPAYPLDVVGDTRVGWHGKSDTILILPSDFQPDDDAGTANGNRLFMNENANPRGVATDCPSGCSDLFAFIPIPVGYKATHTMIYGNVSPATIVYECDVSTGTWTQLGGTGNVNTEFDHPDALNLNGLKFLSIAVNVGASTDIYYGGYVLIQRK